ncbi:MAG: hypothetical protein U1F51_07930 [Burkholderiales bacterium]
MTRLPAGERTLIGSNSPALSAMLGSRVSAKLASRNDSHEWRLPRVGTLNAAATCGSVPSKSSVISPARALIVPRIRIGIGEVSSSSR